MFADHDGHSTESEMFSSRNMDWCGAIATWRALAVWNGFDLMASGASKTIKSIKLSGQIAYPYGGQA